jgi:hypothetical protein
MIKAKPTVDRALTDVGVDAKAMEAIGRALKAHYDHLVQAPLPERFHELVKKLDAAEETAPKGRANAPG